MVGNAYIGQQSKIIAPYQAIQHPHSQPKNSSWKQESALKQTTSYEKMQKLPSRDGLPHVNAAAHSSLGKYGPSEDQVKI